jgi:hypothetical protein
VVAVLGGRVEVVVVEGAAVVVVASGTIGPMTVGRVSGADAPLETDRG